MMEGVNIEEKQVGGEGQDVRVNEQCSMGEGRRTRVSWMGHKIVEVLFVLKRIRIIR